MELFQQSGAVLFVLALLAGTLFILRRKGIAGIRMPASRGRASRQMQSIDRLVLTPQHSLHLIDIAGRAVVVAVSPAGCSILEGEFHIPRGGEIVA